MAFVVEDGTGLPGANSFASLTEFNAYLAGRLYASTQSAATDADKEKALMMATQVIDASWVWKGNKKTDDQALGWPRLYALEYGYPSTAYSWRYWSFGGYRYYDSDSVPKGVKDATCEMARELLVADLTTDTDERGIKSTTVGPLSVEFDPADRRAMIPDLVSKLLRPFGTSTTAKSRWKNVRRV